MKTLLLALAIAPLGGALGLIGGHMVKLEAPPAADAVADDAADPAAQAEGGGDAAEGEGETARAYRPDDAGTDAEAAPRLAGGAPPPDAAPVSGAEYVKLDRQFVVPVVEGEKVAALMVVSLALEIDEGGSDAVFTHEPKLRDEFLKVLFLHAQSGGFAGAFTREKVMADLRGSLASAAQGVLGGGARSVLLTNMVRQDL